MTCRPAYVPQLSHAKCGRLGCLHCGHSTVVTGCSFQFAARRLRVLLRGVFHFRFAILELSLSRGAAPRAAPSISFRAASLAQSVALWTAPYSHRQCTQHHLLRKIRDVDPPPHEHVVLTERIAVAIARQIEALVDIRANLEVDWRQARGAVTDGAHLNLSLHLKPAIHSPKLETNLSRPLENNPFEGIDRHLVLNLHDLPAAGQEPPDIDSVRPNHEMPPRLEERGSTPMRWSPCTTWTF